MLLDLRYALRALTKQPGFYAVAVLILALGVASASTIFGAVNTVLFRDLPVRDPDRLVRIFAVAPRSGLTDAFSYPDYRDYEATNRTFEGLVGVAPLRAGLTIEGNALLVSGELVTPNYFDVLGVDLTLGGGFAPGEQAQPGALPVVVLGHDVWQRVLGGDPGVVGRVALLNGRSYTVAGVTPPGFHGTNFAVRRDLWVPIVMRGDFAGPPADDRMAALDPAWIQDRATPVMALMGRLRPGVGRGQAQADLDALARGLAEAHPVTHEGIALRVLPERAGLINPETPQAVTMAGVAAAALVVLVLLVVCGNVAGLLLARAVTREREIGVRAALGADRVRLLRPILAEAAALALPACLLGLLFAFWASRLITAFLPAGAGPGVDFTPDARVMGFGLGVAALTVMLFALPPALHATRGDVMAVLRTAGGSVGRSPARMLRAVAAAQFALSTVVLMIAGLFVRASLWQQRVDPGFEADGRAMMALDLRVASYTMEGGRVFYQDLVRRVGTLPGIRSAALTRVAPLGLTPELPVRPESEGPAADSTTASRIGYNVVSPGYFATLGIPLRAGRDFQETDSPGAVRVAIINQTLARRFWPGRDPTGERLRLGEEAAPVVVVGVAADAKYTALAEEPRPFVYLPFQQRYQPAMALAVWAQGDLSAAVRLVREEISRLDAGLPVAGVTTVTDAVASDRALARTVAALTSSLGALVLLLAAAGLHGVVAFAVRRRTREIGVRIALGAGPAEVIRLVTRQGLSVLLPAALVGLGLSLAVGRLLAGLTFGVSPWDPAGFGVVAGSLVLAAVAALYGPIRRTTRIDPVEALRAE